MSEQRSVEELENQLEYHKQRLFFNNKLELFKALGSHLTNLTDAVEVILDSSVTMNIEDFSGSSALKAAATYAIFEISKERQDLEITRQNLLAWEAKLGEGIRICAYQIAKLDNEKQSIPYEQLLVIQDQINELIN